jgi:hypothetical protein
LGGALEQAQPRAIPQYDQPLRRHQRKADRPRRRQPPRRADLVRAERQRRDRQNESNRRAEQPAFATDRSEQAGSICAQN